MSQNLVRRQELWYPSAKREELPTQGEYEHSYPAGAIVHFTSGSSADGAIQEGRARGYSFFVIDRDGAVIQGAPLNRWGRHAGESEHVFLGKDVSRKTVGIEVVSAGLVEKVPLDPVRFKAWFHKRPEQYFEKHEVRTLAQKIDNVQPGSYHKYTREQEDSLVELIVWLKRNNKNVFSLDRVLGHDEVSPRRKCDPGASLSMTMPQFRAFLKQEFEKKESTNV